MLAVTASADEGDVVGAFGTELPIARDLGVGPTMDVAVRGSWAYVIGQGKLHVADASEPARPRVVGSLGGLGNTRQVVVADNVAYVSSRADGLFIVSVKEPAAPKLLCHYDTIEWATGLAISGHVLFVACRNFGVELVDVSNPGRPRHLSTVRTGEAQSVVARNGWLYAGVWGTSEVVVADVRNPRQPHVVARAPLDGYGDGVDVRGNLLFVATGHHSRAPHRGEDDPGFGRGHGLEMFDISDPAKPVFLGRVKFPKCYQLGNDMWGVTASGRYAFCADTYNGVFVVDVSDRGKPLVVAHRQLPIVESRKLPGFVGGLALAQDHLYAAGGWTDLHVIAASGLATPPTVERDSPPAIPPAPVRDGGQVYAVDLVGDVAVVARGSAGIQVVQAGPTIHSLAEYPTADAATDVSVLGNKVFVAEGGGGLSIWEASPSGALEWIGRYRVPGERVRHVSVPAPGKYALVQVGEAWLHILDVSDPAAPKLALKDSRLGLLYGHQIMDGLLENRYAAVFWHVSGLHWYDLGGPKPVYAGQDHADRFNPQDGVAVLDGQVLATRRGGYVIFERGDKRSLDDLPLRQVAGLSISGKPTIRGHRLYVSNRATGAVSVLDITDTSAPKVLESFVTAGNPGRIVAGPKGFLVPDGYGGLLLKPR